MDKRAVYDGAGALIHLTERLNAGDQGEIYRIDGTSGYCAKIFYEKQCTMKLLLKIMTMVAHQPDAGQINRRKVHGTVVLAWPSSVLYDSPLGSRNFIGYVMPFVDTDLFREADCYYDPQSRIRLFDGAFSWRYLLTAVYHIAVVTDDIHCHGHCFGDFSGRNILISPTGAVAVINCDSFQVCDGISGRIFPSSAGNKEYLPPELQGDHLTEGRVDQYYGDLFSLAVMIFRLFMDGVHPFQAEGEGVSAFSDIEQQIQNGVFAFAIPNEHIQPFSSAPDYRTIPLSLRRLFYRCFVDGIEEPKLRPSAGDWKDCLHSEIMAMKHCRVNKNHWFGGHLLECPWCSPGEQDIFPVESLLSNGDEPVVADTIFPVEERVHLLSSASPSPLQDNLSGMSESLLEEFDASGYDRSVSEIPEPVLPESIVQESDEQAYEVTESAMPKSDIDESQDDDSEMPVSPLPESDQVISAVPDSPLGIYLSEPHVTMHNLSRGITIPLVLPVTVTGNGPLLIHVTSDARWIEIGNSAVTVEGKGGVHVTLNTGNMTSKGFQKGRVMLQAGEIQEEIFLFVSVTPEI